LTREHASQALTGIREVASWTQDGGTTFAVALAMPLPASP
jgi:hypothetical protein